MLIFGLSGWIVAFALQAKEAAPPRGLFRPEGERS